MGGVIQMWEECKANEDVLPLEAFNAFIRSIRNENVEKCMEKVRNVLEEMKNNKLNPNTNTLISTLVVLKNTASGADYAQSCKYSLDLVAEFRNAGVNMSLGVYKMLLDIFVNLKSKQKNTILVDIMKAVEGQDFWPAGDEEDFYFFPRAMQVALYLNNSSLSWSINELLHTGNNLALLSHHNNETMYYNYFMSNVLQNDDFETAIELYNKVTPHIWCPSSTFYKNLLNAVHSHRGMNHLGKIYEDLYLSDMAGSNKETNYELNYQVMQILQSNDPNTSEFTGLTDVWLDITKKVFNHLETNIDNRNFGLRFNTHAANICSLCIMLNSNLGSYEQAVKVFKFCQEYRAIMPGQLPEQAVKTLLQQSLELKESATCLEIVEYALDIDNNTAISLANMVTDRLTLQTQDIKYLNKLFANSPEWKPL